MFLTALQSEGRMAPHYQVRRSARARRLRITVRPAGVEVTAPLDACDAEILAFVNRNRHWIETRIGAIQHTLAAHAGSDRLADGVMVPYRGRWERLAVVPSTCARAKVCYRSGVRVELPERLPPDAQEAAIERALVGWLEQQAKHEAAVLIDRYGPKHGLLPTGLKIKGQRSLWGSCTAHGVINLNRRLILAPPEVLEYVVVHELCHLRHRHHRPPFWRLVGKLLPDYQRHRRWLKANGHLLTLKPEPFAVPSEDRGAGHG